MANETILVVDGDTQSRKVLEVSFKKSGYRVLMTESAAEALECLARETPDLIVSDTDLPDGDGFGLCKEVKARSEWEHIPFLFLTEEASLPQKIEGLEIGADDYLTRPIYIKEVTTRVEVLLQKRDREMLSDGGVEEFAGELENITLIDLLQTIDEESRTGVIEFERRGRRGTMTFRDGRVIDARCGKLQGEHAIYRLMLWPSGKFVVNYRDRVPGAVHIDKSTEDLLIEGIQHLQLWDQLIEDMPSLDRVFETDYHALPELLDEVPEEVGRIVRLFDGFRTLREVIDDSPVGDVTSLRIIRRIFDEGVLEEVSSETAGESASRSRSHLADWLEEGLGGEGEQPEETPEPSVDEPSVDEPDEDVEPTQPDEEVGEVSGGDDEAGDQEDTSPGYPGTGPDYGDPSETMEIEHDDLATALSRELENSDRQFAGASRKLEGNERELEESAVEPMDSSLEESSSGESSGPRYMPSDEPDQDGDQADGTLSELAEAERLRREEEAKRLVEQQDEEVAADGGGARFEDEGVPRIPGATQAPENEPEDAGGQSEQSSGSEPAPADQTDSGEWQKTFASGENELPANSERTDTPRSRPTADRTAPWRGEADGNEDDGGRLDREDANSGVPVSFQTVDDGESDRADSSPGGAGGSQGDESAKEKASAAIRESARKALDEAAAVTERQLEKQAEESDIAPEDRQAGEEMPEVERVSTDGKMVREEYDLSRESDQEKPADESKERGEDPGDFAAEASGTSGAEEVLLDEGLEWDEEPTARPGESRQESTTVDEFTKAASEDDQPEAEAGPDDEHEETHDVGEEAGEGQEVDESDEAAAWEEASQSEADDSEAFGELTDTPHEKIEEASSSGTDEWPGSRVEKLEDVEEESVDESAAEAESKDDADREDEKADRAESTEPAEASDDEMTARFTDEPDESSSAGDPLTDSSSEASFFEEGPEEEFDDDLGWDLEEEQGGTDAWKYVAVLALVAGLGVGAAWAAKIGPFATGSSDDAVATSEEPSEKTEEASGGESGESTASKGTGVSSDDKEVPEPKARGPREAGPFAEKAATSISEGARKTAMILAGKDPAIAEAKEKESSGESGEATGSESTEGGEKRAAASPKEESSGEASSEPTDSTGGGGESSRASESSGGSGFDAEIAEVQSMIDSSNYSGARSRLEELKQQAPNDPEIANLYLDLASGLQIDGSIEQAKKAYREYLDMRPTGSRADEVRSILQRL